MRKVALDSMLSARKVIFKELLAIKPRKQTRGVDYFAKKCSISHSTARRHLEQLSLLGVVKEISGPDDPRKYYALADDVWRDWCQLAS
jgi:hypothetical protein